jgi:hypothetical protein
MDGMEATMQSPKIRVFDRIERARSARTELISAGCRPQDVRILDSRAATLTRYLDGPAIPEAGAGLLVGGLLTSILGVIPQFSPLFDRGGLPLYGLIALGALIGAVASYVIARRHPPTVIERDLADGDYVVIVDTVVVEPRAA